MPHSELKMSSGFKEVKISLRGKPKDDLLEISPGEAVTTVGDSEKTLTKSNCAGNSSAVHIASSF